MGISVKIRGNEIKRGTWCELYNIQMNIHTKGSCNLRKLYLLNYLIRFPLLVNFGFSFFLFRHICHLYVLKVINDIY